MAKSRLPPSDWLGRWCYFFLTNQSAAAQRLTKASPDFLRHPIHKIFSLFHHTKIITYFFNEKRNSNDIFLRFKRFEK